ncbi:MAG: 3-hydroxyacyl-CoA dehydrogenase NAD-binding domain-containing protein [Pseudomonadota bacterium]
MAESAEILVKTETRGNVRIITLDNPPVNAMSIGVPGGAIAALEEANADEAIGAVVLAGGGRGIFGGADIRIQGQPWPEGEPNLRDLIAMLTKNPKPVVALMRSHALGGGLELSLGCHYRVSTPTCQMGQTEVNLGIPPGAGGTQRLPRVIGLEAAAEMVVSGKPISGKKGLEYGLIDRLVGDDFLADAAAFAAEISQNRSHPANDEKRIELPSPDFFESLRKSWSRKSRGARAPQACIDCLEAAVELPIDEGLKREREIFQECVTSDEAKAMRAIFFAERQAARLKGDDAKVEPRQVETVSVLGSGTMGTGITIAFLDGGFPVTLLDTDEEALARAKNRIAKTYDGSIAKGRISAAQKDARMGALTTVTSLAQAAEADMIVEAVFEEMDVKKSIFSELGKLTSPGTILASNTSYLNIDEIASVTGGREADVLGMHFFSPANIMKLLEVVRADKTDPAVLQAALAIGKKLSKISVVAGVCHGFIANRTLEGYMREAQFLLEEGATPSQVDGALTKFGMAMGPLAVADLAGLDISWAKRKAAASTRDPNIRYSAISDRLCENGWFGQKTGRGYYIYDPETRRPSPNPDVDEIIAAEAKASNIERREISDEEIIERCFYTVVNEGARVLAEGIAQRASDIDVAWVNGYGYPRHRGGPMHWADALGAAKILARIEEFHAQHHFWEPAPLLRQLAKENKTFASLSEG